MWIHGGIGLAVGLMLLVPAYALDMQSSSTFVSTYGKWVDDKGNISLPKDFLTRWVFLGTWSVAAKDVERSSEASGHGVAGLHNVYTQPGVVEYFREHGSFPDGAILIKELLKGVTSAMTTGTVSRAGAREGWFIMVKDSQGRFEGNSLWGDGWGWALFNVENPVMPVTQNYRFECTGCHLPARETDWVYVDGYPLLKTDSVP
ncbi:MAG: cytochrome P460 family protein [Chromatiales bacterium]|nr:cytochrome P460 family protein [Chromatiales bacterium]